jgi:hypothetical protein
MNEKICLFMILLLVDEKTTVVNLKETSEELLRRKFRRNI